MASEWLTLAGCRCLPEHDLRRASVPLLGEPRAGACGLLRRLEKQAADRLVGPRGSGLWVAGAQAPTPGSLPASCPDQTSHQLLPKKPSLQVG